MKHFTQLEEVYFSYRKISWDHVGANTVGSYDWRDEEGNS